MFFLYNLSSKLTLSSLKPPQKRKKLITLRQLLSSMQAAFDKMTSLPTLPTELIVEIAQLLPPADIKNFSSTSRHLRHAVTHILFHTLNIACPLVSHKLLDHMLNK